MECQLAAGNYSLMASAAIVDRCDIIRVTSEESSPWPEAGSEVFISAGYKAL